MTNKTGTIALRVIGSVLAGFIAVGAVAGTSSIAAGGSGSDSVVAGPKHDTGW